MLWCHEPLYHLSDHHVKETCGVFITLEWALPKYLSFTDRAILHRYCDLHFHYMFRLLEKHCCFSAGQPVTVQSGMIMYRLDTKTHCSTQMNVVHVVNVVSSCFIVKDKLLLCMDIFMVLSVSLFHWKPVLTLSTLWCFLSWFEWSALWHIKSYVSKDEVNPMV